jgi:hypothetical protein
MVLHVALLMRLRPNFGVADHIAGVWVTESEVSNRMMQ